MKKAVLIIGLLLLFAAEILRVYYIMPFPGSQRSNSIGFAYWLDKNIGWLRILLIALIAYPLWNIFMHSGRWAKIISGACILIYVFVFYKFNFRFQADKMFYQPRTKTFASSKDNKIPTDKLIIGVEINGEAKAYPIQLIGYHHQVRDTIGNIPVMITYCTVCRTGRAFSPTVNGHNEVFRLVGMDHFNAMFEDSSTRSWWRQETGGAIAGPLNGSYLREIPSRQVKLATWLQEYPNSLILQRDTVFNEDYNDLADFDRGTLKSSLEKRDSASWKFKSWVLGVANGKEAKAYDWNELVQKRIIQDSMRDLPLLITLEADTASFHVLNRMVNGKSLQFELVRDSLRDLNTNSIWTMAGSCTNGQLQGTSLKPVQAYQEFWHSWSTFHPNTTKHE